MSKEEYGHAVQFDKASLVKMDRESGEQKILSAMADAIEACVQKAWEDAGLSGKPTLEIRFEKRNYNSIMSIASILRILDTPLPAAKKAKTAKIGVDNKEEYEKELELIGVKRKRA
jgi:hypothetical protein